MPTWDETRRKLNQQMVESGSRLEQPSFDGAKKATLGHGDHCVALMIVDAEGTEGGIVLTPDGARHLAALLREQAGYSEHPT